MATVALSGVSKRFGDTPVLDSVSLEIEDGEAVVFVGPSGCGKSTLLRLIAGLDDPSGGEIRIGGRDVTEVGPAERGVAMVFQSYALYPHLSVYENLAFALRLAKRPQAEIDQAVRAAAETLAITPLLDRKPKALSGGQRQRVAIGRAIVRSPEVFLFDEPLSNLDAELRGRMRYEFARLHQQLGRTMIYVTHDQVEAMTLADRIVVLAGGVVQQVGAPMELYHRPANRFVAGFIGSPGMNMLPGVLEGFAGGLARVRLADGAVVEVAADASGAVAGASVTVGVRPEHWRRDAATPNALELPVMFVEALGGVVYAYLTAPGGEGQLVVQTPGDLTLKAGDRARLGFDPAEAHLFAEPGPAFPRLGRD
jgi:multiple sugar transport system ATP-binding protein